MPQRLWPRNNVSGLAYGEVVAGLLFIALSATVYAGTLTPGKPRVESDRYEVPIYLNGAGNEVAALDFSLAYDPAVFKPVSISPGAAASAAGKVVTANLPEPGKYIVVMMGFNQTSVANGEVARIVLERVGTSPRGETTLAVNDPTLSTWEGVELPSEGGITELEADTKEEKPSTGEGTKPDSAKPEKPTASAEGEDQSAKPRGGAQVPAAEEVEEKGAVTVLHKRSETGTRQEQASGTVKDLDVPPDVAGAAARAEEERGRLVGIPAGSQSGIETKAVSVATKQDGPQARSSEIQTASSLKIEASDTVNNNTAESTPTGGAQRTGVVAGGGMRLGLAAAVVLLAVAGAAWILRSKISR